MFTNLFCNLANVKLSLVSVAQLFLGDVFVTIGLTFLDASDVMFEQVDRKVQANIMREKIDDFERWVEKNFPEPVDLPEFDFEQWMQDSLLPDDFPPLMCADEGHFCPLHGAY